MSLDWSSATTNERKKERLRQQGKLCLRESRKKFTSDASTRQTSTIKLGRSLVGVQPSQMYDVMPDLSRQIYAVPDSCCIVSRGSVESVGGVFDPVVSSAIAVFEHDEDELSVIPCLLLATL